MEAVFAKDTGELFSCVGSAAAPGKSFYCPSTPHTLNTNNKVAVLTPSNSVLVSAQPPKQQVSLSTTLTAQSYSTLTHSPPATYMYYENWPTSCSSQHTPSTSPQAPPTTNSQRSCCVSVERPLVFEKEEEERRPSLARLIERFRTAAPTSREERGKENCTPFQLPPCSHSTTSDITPSTPHTNNTSSFTDPSPHVSDNSLDNRSQGLINRSSLISPSSTMASSPPTNNYFNSKRETIFLPALMNPPPNDGVSSPRTGSKVTSRCFIGSVNVEEDILYQWRLRRRLEEARRDAKSEGMRTQVYTTTLDAGMETGISGMGTGPDRTGIRIDSKAAKPDSIESRPDDAGMGIAAGIGTGLGVGITEPILAPYQLAGATVTKHEEREKDIGTLTDLHVGVVCSSREEHGGVKSPSGSTSSSPRVNRKDEVVGIDCSSYTCTVKEEWHTTDKQPTSTKFNTENLIPLSQQQQQQGEEGLGATKNQSTIPPSSKGPETESSSSDIEDEPETASVNQSMSIPISVTQLNQPTTVIQAHTPNLHGDGYHGNNGLDLGGVGVEESSYWTITPCGSPDSGWTPHNLGPLINEMVGDRLFDHHSSATPTPSKTTHQVKLDSGATAAVGPSWKHDMNDDLLRLLIAKAHCFEAGIRRIDHLLEQLQSDTTDR